MKQQFQLKGVANFFSVNFDSIDPNDALNTYRYLMKGKQYKTFFGLFKKCLWVY